MENKRTKMTFATDSHIECTLELTFWFTPAIAMCLILRYSFLCFLSALLILITRHHYRVTYRLKGLTLYHSLLFSLRFQSAKFDWENSRLYPIVHFGNISISRNLQQRSWKSEDFFTDISLFSLFSATHS